MWDVYITCTTIHLRQQQPIKNEDATWGRKMYKLHIFVYYFTVISIISISNVRSCVNYCF